MCRIASSSTNWKLISSVHHQSALPILPSLHGILTVGTKFPQLNKSIKQVDENIINHTGVDKSSKHVNPYIIPCPPCIHQTDNPRHMWLDVWSVDSQAQKKSLVTLLIHDTKCPNWNQLSLNNTNSHSVDLLKWYLLHGALVCHSAALLSASSSRSTLSSNRRRLPLYPARPGPHWLWSKSVHVSWKLGKPFLSNNRWLIKGPYISTETPVHIQTPKETHWIVLVHLHYNILFIDFNTFASL